MATGGAPTAADAGPSTGLAQLLMDTQSENPDKRCNAENQLRAAEAQNFSAFAGALCAEMADEAKSDTIRQIAGLLLKNSISGVDSKIDSQKRNKWIELPGEVKQEMKTLLLRILETQSPIIRSTSSQVISKIARIDLPTNNWMQLMPHLETITSASSPAYLRASGHQLLGFICEDIQILSDDVGNEILSEDHKTQILRLLFQGLVDGDAEVKLAALRGFYHGILFADKFMQIESDRSSVFTVVGSSLSSATEAVEAAAWEVMLQIANEFYPILGAYMPSLRDMSLSRIAGGTEKSALSAIEFWSTICDEEILIMEGDSRRPFQQYIHTYKDSLLPVLFEATTQADEDEDCLDDDEWNVAMAAGTSIGLCAQVLKDEILPLALTFIEANFGHAKWNRREAAVLVYGSVLEGPSTRAFGPALRKSFEPLCKGLHDESRPVRDTTAWTIARVAKFHLPTIVDYLGTPETSGLISLLVRKLADDPRVASNVCFALYEIVEGMGKPNAQSPIDPFFTMIAEACVAVAKRSDAGENNLRQNAYHVLYILVKEVGVGEVQTQAMKILLSQLMDWMEETLLQPFGEQIAAIQGPMCGCLNALINRLGKGVLPAADRLYAILQKTISVQWPIVETGGTWNPAAEEALLAINTLIMAIQQSFSRYMNVFDNILLVGLRSREDSELCSIAINIVGNLVSSLGDEIAPYIPRLVEELIKTLKLSSAPISLKPKAMSALADMATYVPKLFSPYLKEFLLFLGQAATTKINEGPLDSEDWVAYIYDLRDSTMIAYSSCIYCVRDLGATAVYQDSSTPQTLLEAEVKKILDLIYLVMGDTISSKSNIKNALMLTQDLVQHFKSGLVAHIRGLPLYALMRERCSQANDQEIECQSMALDEMMAKYST
eukprot:Gregarina_sp_Pseudo_9__3621@NODE_377_length_3007_cov_24_904987_g356_i0_p1_GENE_NODE_377_length_3007_cov_24_904987_g356_i0NODE_377_length_3007_cov_24_904987_g356_i0_p1_ORF_typecomplete_len892_score275_78HEAT_EZ/PF13513_6/1_4e02HEAT_EZ/PF13513_6/1_1e03HEAT_EZ/PF13513_6/3_8e07HEAT_EZ/PF13513_6/3_9e02HEAT_EZ/PF13513_6/3_5HEAT_EZ/PF13513_6/1_1e02CLASP_N/PF12348_8/6_5e03CLASP_N/PF12348_8/0_017CLASP_N/PF12348_8/6_8CLASP_N/PF12348_8/4e02CLASP_N/PF12348_8/6e02CLASP_N/PF12348_8/0_0049CLASP_N/PF12348_8/9_8